MPRLVINGLIDTQNAVTQVHVNAAARGSGAQSVVLYDKTVKPNEDGLFELPVQSDYQGGELRVIIECPGFDTIDVNVPIHEETNVVHLSFSKAQTFNPEAVVNGFGSLEDYEKFSPVNYARERRTLLESKLKRNKREDNLSTIIVAGGALFLSTILYFLIGGFAVIILVGFGFYYRAKYRNNL